MRQLVRHGAFLSISASRTLEHPHTSYLIPSKRFYAPPTFVDYRASSAPVHSTYLHVICRCDETPNMECSNEHVHQSTICCIRITGLDTVGSVVNELSPWAQPSDPMKLITEMWMAIFVYSTAFTLPDPAISDWNYIAAVCAQVWLKKCIYQKPAWNIAKLHYE